MPDIDTSRLEAVNTMLSYIGEAPVNSLTTSVILDVALADRVLTEQDRLLQLRGWHWNTDEDFVALPNAASKYPWGLDWIRFDVSSARYTGIDIVRRGQFLWDRKNSTFIFSETELEGRLVRYLGWDELPESARSFIMVRAARIFLSRTLGDEVRLRYAVEDERRAWHALEEAESEQGDYNILNVGAGPQIRRRMGGAVRLQ